MYIYHNRTTGQITLHARPHGPVLDMRSMNAGVNLNVMFPDEEAPTLGRYRLAYVAADDSWRLEGSHRIVAG